MCINPPPFPLARLKLSWSVTLLQVKQLSSEKKRGTCWIGSGGGVRRPEMHNPDEFICHFDCLCDCLCHLLSCSGQPKKKRQGGKGHVWARKCKEAGDAQSR